ncbi:hypothetical protein [Methanosarcina sp. DH2]|uniref:hypothetical protein n=1 Tax=Methanosarcina sp. DH2 TaxID=2605639 RepID=UPI001E4180F3|nr:hypothetical protein [Methanosarcina sp. DH2]
MLTYLDKNDVLGDVFDTLSTWKNQNIPSEIKPTYDKLYEEAYSLHKTNDVNKPSLFDKVISALSNAKNKQELPRARIIANYIQIIPQLPPDVLRDFEVFFGIDKELEKYGRTLIIYEKLFVEGGTKARYYAVAHCLLDLYEVYFRKV